MKVETRVKTKLWYRIRPNAKAIAKITKTARRKIRINRRKPGLYFRFSWTTRQTG